MEGMESVRRRDAILQQNVGPRGFASACRAWFRGILEAGIRGTALTQDAQQESRPLGVSFQGFRIEHRHGDLLFLVDVS
jgi:hypothetical protein